jgi:hypothetical protein
MGFSEKFFINSERVYFSVKSCGEHDFANRFSWFLCIGSKYGFKIGVNFGFTS